MMPAGKNTTYKRAENMIKVDDHSKSELQQREDIVQCIATLE